MTFMTFFTCALKNQLPPSKDSLRGLLKRKSSCLLQNAHFLGALSLLYHWMFNFMAAELPERLSALLVKPILPQGTQWRKDRGMGEGPATVSWHFPWLLLRNSWAIIEGYSGIPIGLTGARILNWVDTKSIQLWNVTTLSGTGEKFLMLMYKSPQPKVPKISFCTMGT